jgi:Carboxypeptidase regulatory-like domain
VPKPSISGLQAAVGLTAGLISIVGAAYSAVQIFRPPAQHGEVVAIVREARTERPIADATIEVFTPREVLVTTLTPTSKGQVRHTLKEGPYRLRVSHPKFGAEVRQIVVQSGQTAEVRFQLVQRTGGSSPLGEAARAVEEGVGTVHRFIRGLGL